MNSLCKPWFKSQNRPISGLRGRIDINFFFNHIRNSIPEPLSDFQRLRVINSCKNTLFPGNWCLFPELLIWECILVLFSFSYLTVRIHHNSIAGGWLWLVWIEFCEMLTATDTARTTLTHCKHRDRMTAVCYHHPVFFNFREFKTPRL